MKKSLLFLLSLGVGLSPLLSYSQSSPPVVVDNSQKSNVQQMLGYFGNRCSVNGSWTEAITDSVNKITEIVKTADSDPQCRGLGGLLNQLNIIRSRVQYLNQDENQVENEINGYQTRVREIVLLLAQNPSSNEQLLLEQELVSARLSLASSQGQLVGTGRLDALQRKENSYYQIVTSTNSIMNAIAAQEACWSRRPGLLENVAGLGTAVTQSISLASALSTNSLLLGAGVGIATNFIEALSRAAHEREIRKLYDTVGPGALNCALENLNNIYCGASETLDLIEQNQAYKRQNPNLDQLNPLQGPQKVVRYYLPVINDWISKVRAGAAPASRYFADERSSIQRTELALRLDMATVQGIINAKKSLFSQTTDRVKQWDLVKKVLTEMTSRLFTSCEGSYCSDPSSSLGTIITMGEFPYVLLQIPSSEYRGQNYPNGIKPFSQYDVSPEIPLSLDNITREYERLNQRAAGTINDQLNETLNPDKKSVFLLAVTVQQKGNVRGLSPKKALNEIKNYLLKYQSDIIDSDPAKIYLETIQLITQMDQIIDGVISNQMDVNVGLQKINDLLQLRQTNSYLQDRVRQFVRLHIQNILDKPNQLQNPVYARWIASQDVLEELTDFQGKDQTLLQNDASNAIDVYQRIYPLFLETFKKPIERAFKGWQQTTNSSNSDSSFSFRIKSIFCSQLLGQNSWSHGIGLGFCENTQVRSVSTGISTPTLNEAYFNSQTRKSRVCAYRNMLRQSAIRERKSDQP